MRYCLRYQEPYCAIHGEMNGVQCLVDSREHGHELKGQQQHLQQSRSGPRLGSGAAVYRDMHALVPR
jgi:hypothetical protein